MEDIFVVAAWSEGEEEMKWTVKRSRISSHGAFGAKKPFESRECLVEGTRHK
jgi:hypothetical protein